MEVLGPVLPSLAVLSALQIKSEFYAAIILGLLTWNGLAVFLRDEYAVLVQSTFVQAAVGLGATRTQVLWRHIIPHITARLGPLLLALFATYAGLIGALGFLGVAGDASHSLGFMIYDAKSFCRQRPSYFIGSLLCFLLLITLPHLLLRTVNSSSGTRGAA